MDIFRIKLKEMDREIFDVRKLPFLRLEKASDVIDNAFPENKEKKSIFITTYH